MTIEQGIREVAKIRKELHEGVVDAVNQATFTAVIFAVRSSSGPFSASMLAKMDHPYATRHGAPKLNPAFINSQTGAFARDWRGSYALKSDYSTRGVTASITNDNPVADYLQFGTVFMVPRPIADLIQSRWMDYAEREILKLKISLERKYA
jgi:hypothetical protein